MTLGTRRNVRWGQERHRRQRRASDSDISSLNIFTFDRIQQNQTRGDSGNTTLSCFGLFNSVSIHSERCMFYNVLIAIIKREKLEFRQCVEI